MGDLAKRPRGGWQVGNFRQKRGRNFGPYTDENPDPAPNVYSVHRTDDERSFTVRHFAHVDDEKPCCRAVKVTRREGEAAIDALTRAYLMVQRQHRPAAEVA